MSPDHTPSDRVGVMVAVFNPLERRDNYSLTSNNMNLVGTLAVDGCVLLHLVQRGGDWAGPQPT